MGGANSCRFVYNLHHLHHAQVLVVEDVAVYDELTDVVGVGGVDVGDCRSLYEQCVFPYELGFSVWPCPHPLEWIDMDVKNMRRGRGLDRRYAVGNAGGISHCRQGPHVRGVEG